MSSVKVKTELVNISDPKSLMEFLQEPTAAMAETLTGILSSDTKDWKLSAGKLITASIRGKLLTQFGRELKKYRDAGKIEEDFLESSINQSSFSDLLKFIDEDAPDEYRFRAMKSIFFSIVESDSSEAEKAFGYQLLKICRQLESGEILTIAAIYRLVNKKGKTSLDEANLKIYRIPEWSKIVAQEAGHNMSGLILQHEKHLVDLQLISGLRHSVNVNELTDIFRQTPYFRLTELGYKLAEFISKYD